MAKILTFEIPENEYNEFKEFLDKATVEMRRSHEKMQQDQIEIDRLSVEIAEIQIATAQFKAISDKVLAELEAKHSVFAG